MEAALAHTIKNKAEAPGDADGFEFIARSPSYRAALVEYRVALGLLDAAQGAARDRNTGGPLRAYEAVRKANEVLNGARWAVRRTIDEPSARAVLSAPDSESNAVNAASEALAAWQNADVSRALKEGTELRIRRIGIDTELRMVGVHF